MRKNWGKTEKNLRKNLGESVLKGHPSESPKSITQFSLICAILEGKEVWTIKIQWVSNGFISESFLNDVAKIHPVVLLPKSVKLCVFAEFLFYFWGWCMKKWILGGKWKKMQNWGTKMGKIGIKNGTKDNTSNWK